MAVLIAAGTFAPAIPPLRRIPVVGAAHPLKATFSISGDEGLRVRLPQGRSRSVIVRVGIQNTMRPDVDRAAVNFLVPMAITPVHKVSHDGQVDSVGQWLPPTVETDHEGKRTDFAVWANHPANFPGRNASLLHFRVTLSHAGTYLLRLKITAPSLADEFNAEAVITAEVDAST